MPFPAAIILPVAFIEDSALRKKFVDPIQSEIVTADGTVYERDGLKYLVVEKILTNEGIAATHEDYGLTPPFAIPKQEKARILGAE